VCFGFCAAFVGNTFLSGLASQLEIQAVRRTVLHANFDRF
jgi:hypothetical protein